MDNNLMKKKSEEWCGACNYDFETNSIRTLCPNCGCEVISCYNCNRFEISTSDTCKTCERGSDFIEKS